MSASKRQHPRFASQNEVELELPGRSELGKLWTTDISKGGLFITTKEPPALSTKLRVRIGLPEGRLELEAVVVHVVDVATARARQTAPGIGVQFTTLGPRERQAIHAFVDGLAAKLSVEATSEVATKPTSKKPLDRAQRFLEAMREEDLYGAVDLPPLAGKEEIDTRIGELRSLFRTREGLSPAQQTRLETALRLLERVRHLLADPESRLDFDFRHDILMVDERVRLAPHPAALALLRKVWLTRFPGAAELADGCWALASRAYAAGDLEGSVRHALDALESDPFRWDRRESLARWIDRSGHDYRKVVVLPPFVRP